jgi:hypothetical protein
MLLFGSVTAVSHEGQPTARILIIDATRTLSSTLRMAGLVGALRQTGLLDVSVRFSDETSRFADPLSVKEEAPADAPFDLILILPRALDTDTDVMIWLVSRWIPSLAPRIRQAVEIVSQITDAVFSGAGQTVDGWTDLWPLLLAALHQQQGWLR